LKNDTLFKTSKGSHFAVFFLFIFCIKKSRRSVGLKATTKEMEIHYSNLRDLIKLFEAAFDLIESDFRYLGGINFIFSSEKKSYIDSRFKDKTFSLTEMLFYLALFSDQEINQDSFVEGENWGPLEVVRDMSESVEKYIANKDYGMDDLSQTDQFMMLQYDRVKQVMMELYYCSYMESGAEIPEYIHSQICEYVINILSPRIDSVFTS